MKKIIFGGLLLAFLTGGIGALVWFYKIERITCMTQYGPCSDGLASQLSDEEGQNYLRSKRAVARILSEDIKARDFTIRFKLWNRLVVYVIERKAQVAFLRNDGGYALASDDGTVLGVADETQLPIIVLGETLEDEEKGFLTQMIFELFKWRGVRKAEVHDGGAWVRIDDREVILPLEGELDTVLGSLNLVLSWLNTNASDTRIGVVDLRYNNPVLR